MEFFFVIKDFKAATNMLSRCINQKNLSDLASTYDKFWPPQMHKSEILKHSMYSEVIPSNNARMRVLDV